MAKKLFLDVSFAFDDRTIVVSGVSPQEAFNILHMPSIGELICTLSPSWVEVEDGLPPMPEPENKE